MFQSHTPVTRDAFHDREVELGRVLDLVERLASGGGTTWLAILGQRKVGKTSLLLEARRRTEGRVAFVLIDLFERSPVDLEVFRTYALRALDALAAVEVGRSFEGAAKSPDYPGLLARSDVVMGLSPDWRDFLFRLPTLALDADGVARCLDLPEALAERTGRAVVSAWDEFQELAIGAGRAPFDVLAAIRSAWQRHARVAYVVSGSEPTLLRELTTSRRSPFFQHFALLELGPMARRDAVALIGAASEGALSRDVGEMLVDAVGGQPFYLQVLGDEMLRDGPPFDRDAVKHTLQRTLFSRAGRLGLYLERLYAGLVGRSAQAAAVLGALSAHPDGARLSDVARTVGAATGDTARTLERLGDAVVKEDGRWRVVDPAFRLWLAWREPLGTVVPMNVLGDEAEKATAQALAGMGFDLVYQSRASRGAFDLLATRGASMLAVQVKRSALPLALPRDAWARMEAEAERFGWRWVVAAVKDAHVTFLDPASARVQRTARLDGTAAIPNLLSWLDAR